ncbi:MAG TPA: competence/damage-inducible protein A [Geobacteraceae bacterium]|nr:competence/damage-inducible protein A [Geobacteraceae bacterium]
MKVATLSIGDEVVFGEIFDTNAPFIAQRLYDTGLKVRRHLAVGDAEEDITAAIRTLAATSEAVIATGGLGPTCDDITAEAAAKASGCRLVQDQQALAHLRDFLAGRGRNVDPANEKQTFFPVGSELIPNPVGTACGFRFQLDGCDFFFLPGVPKEMMRMIEDSVIPMIRKLLKQERIIRVKVLKLFGLPEAEAGIRLEGLTAQGSPVTVAFQVDFPEIFVKLRAEGDNDRQVASLLDDACRKVRERLHGYIFAEDDETIDSVVAGLLREKHLTLSLAESCTGGLLAKRITDIPGSSAYFLEGIVTYSNAAKIRALGISAQLLEKRGAVSAEVAMAMAEGIRNKSGSDIALAVTGVAGPDGGTAEKPVGTVFAAICADSGCHAKEFRFHGSREEIRTMTSFAALDWLRQHLHSSNLHIR